MPGDPAIHSQTLEQRRATSKLTQGTLRLMRTVHVYVTAAAATLLLFIAVTGFALTHEAWFGLDTARITTRTEKLPASLTGPADKLAWVEFARATFGAAGPVEPFELTDNPLLLQFRAPGRKTDVSIDRSAGTATATLESRGLLGAMTDLHRAKEVSAPFRLLLDATALSLLLGVITGVVLLLQTPKRRIVRALVLAGGALACVAVCLLAAR